MMLVTPYFPQHCEANQLVAHSKLFVGGCGVSVRDMKYQSLQEQPRGEYRSTQ
jgi:hypothetical protein